MNISYCTFFILPLYKSRAVGLISKLRNFVPRQALLNIYHSLIAPYLIDSLIAWDQACQLYLDKFLVKGPFPTLMQCAPRPNFL